MLLLSNSTHHVWQMVREEGWSSLGRGVGPNVFRSILMNASQLASCVFAKARSLLLALTLDIGTILLKLSYLRVAISKTISIATLLPVL